MEKKEVTCEIEVRTLTGETTTISIHPDETIQHLKLILFNLSFIHNFPNFHLFFKGAKLSLQSRISSFSIEPGEFLVVIPFMKKEKSHNQQQCNQTESSSKCRNESSSIDADSAWTDMMEDLSSMRELSDDKDQTKSFEPHPPEKRLKIGNEQEACLDDLILSILQSSGNGCLDEQNCERLMQVLALVNCLQDQYSRVCVFVREATLRDGNLGCIKNSALCLCPTWLKKIMKAFAFLNTFSAFYRLRCEEITWTLVKVYLDQIGTSVFHIDMKDVEHLSVLCPEKVRIASKETVGTKVGDAIVIVDSSTGEPDLLENNSRSAKRQVSISKMVILVKTRENSFKTKLWKIIKFVMRRNGTVFFSLEDLLMYVEEHATSVKGNKAKKAKRSCFGSSSSHSVETQCHDTNMLSPLEMVGHLRNGVGSDGQIVHVEEIGARRPTYVDIPHGLSQISKSALKLIGVDRIYSHQAEAVQASLAGKNIVVATLTSSGKSLCYNLPVLEVLSENLLACALYLFPTKALAQDQLRALIAMTSGFDASLNIGVYDGDTPSSYRTWLRDNARLLITNPDMLHLSILPSHREFSRILLNLRFVVIDEAHAYKGAFGCHIAMILRRLRRLCSHVYGSDPSFVFCTATSANPREHAMELANLKTCELIQNDGSPSSQKLFVLWNPTLCFKSVPMRFQSSINTKKPDTRVTVKRSSPIMEVSRLFAEMVQHGLRTIAFCKSRKLCELVLSYTREILQEAAPHLVDVLCAYRGGYVAEDRRRIESDFFGGKLCGIAATNALELGIDVGHIDATLHLGFPGSIASLWQQAGRSGRRERPSLSVYVAFESPLDQYFMKFPQKLFRRSIECCHVDTQNQQVLEHHLTCAALEHPLSLLYDEKFFGSGLNCAISSLRNKGYLVSDPSLDSSARIWSYIGHEKKPSRAVSIRSIESEKYKVIDQRINEVIEEIEESKAFFQVYEGAVYMNQGKTYLVKKLDVSGKIALCEQADLKYYTTTRDYTDIHVIGGDVAYPAVVFKNQLSKTSARTQTCKVTTTWFGFHRKQRGSNQIFDTVDLSLPTYSYESQAVWIRVPQSIKTALASETFRAGLHAASHAILHVVPLYLICNVSDLAPECVNPRDAQYIPERILLYDQHPGGSGVSAQIQRVFTELLTAALELLTSCCCSGDTGCPNCIQSLACHVYNEVLHKDAAIQIIKDVIDADKLCF